jgi:site-specific recombinase XerD
LDYVPGLVILMNGGAIESFASNLVTVGLDLITVREPLGHGGINMRLRYSHLSPRVKAVAVEQLV